MNIFVGNLNSLTTEQQLRDLFAPFGEVQSVKIITEFSGRPRGFAFIVMPENESAEHAIRELNKFYLNTQPMVVNEARPQSGSKTFSLK